MAKPKAKMGRPPKPANQQSKLFHVRLPPPIKEAIEEHRRRESFTSDTAALIDIIKGWMKAVQK